MVMAEGPYEARRAKIAALAATGNPSDMPLLLYALSDPDHDVRRAALDGLSQFPTDAALSRSSGAHVEPEPVEPEPWDEVLFWVDVVKLAREQRRAVAENRTRPLGQPSRSPAPPTKDDPFSDP